MQTFKAQFNQVPPIVRQIFVVIYRLASLQQNNYRLKRLANAKRHFSAVLQMHKTPITLTSIYEGMTVNVIALSILSPNSVPPMLSQVGLGE